MSKKPHLPARPCTNHDVRLHDSGLRAGSLMEGPVGRLSPQEAQAVARRAAEASYNHALDAGCAVMPRAWM